MSLILLILFAMLRSVVAPLYLIVAVGLEFAATLGSAVVVFQHAAGQPGVAFTLPLVLFLFVVAIGTDYNMLMSARLREGFEAGLPAKQAVARAIRHAAPPITAAGLVLAMSFGSLMIYDDQATKQTGFGMAIGILLASFVVSTLLVPALTALIGGRSWWPSQIAEDGAPGQPVPLTELNPSRTANRPPAHAIDAAHGHQRGRRCGAMVKMCGRTRHDRPRGRDLHDDNDTLRAALRQRGLSFRD